MAQASPALVKLLLAEAMTIPTTATSMASDWVEMHRHFGRDRELGDHIVGKGTSDVDVRTQFRAWRHYMTGEAA